MNDLLAGVAGGLETAFEPGDRVELTVTDEPDRLLVPPTAWPAAGGAIEAIEDANGAPLCATFDPALGCLSLTGLGELIQDRWPSFWLEYRGPGHFRLVVEEVPPPPESEDLTTDQGVPVHPDPDDRLFLLGASRSSARLVEFQLALRAAGLATHGGFDRLMCLPLLREMELLEHQIRTAKTVLRRFRGRGLLCDEVGLGKTIEAGIVLSELVTRGLVRSLLVLTPPSLVEQWQGELRRKFSLDCTAYDDPAFRAAGPEGWQQFNRLIVSIHTAKREPHRSAIRARNWDMVIVDEAHHLRNRNTQVWRFASELQKRYILLLTATPVQNNLEELFNLVTLLEPGLLSTARQFQKRFVDRSDKLTPRNVDQLHELLSEVMVRNRRSTVGLHFTRRWARTECLPLGAEERALYEDVTRFVRRHLRNSEQRAGLNRMVMISLQMALGSSSQAAGGTLSRLAEQPRLAEGEREELARLAGRARGQVGSSKADRLLELLRELADKTVIFTQFRATQEMLYARLRQAGHDVALFHGGLSRMQKEEAIERFRGPAGILLATESGSEGRNLQFAHAVCNFDLPWNPMKIEQRIGRLSRIGQTRDVHVLNLVAAGTIEAAVLHLLEAKLSMFELVIGEIDMILGNLDDQREFDEMVADLWVESDDTDDFGRRMEELGNRLIAAKEVYFQQRSHDDRLFGNRFAPEG
jgi:SNF2 family DNA or RNA helicase